MYSLVHRESGSMERISSRVLKRITLSQQPLCNFRFQRTFGGPSRDMGHSRLRIGLSRHRWLWVIHVSYKIRNAGFDRQIGHLGEWISTRSGVRFSRRFELHADLGSVWKIDTGIEHYRTVLLHSAAVGHSESLRIRVRMIP